MKVVILRRGAGGLQHRAIPIYRRKRRHCHRSVSGTYWPGNETLDVQAIVGHASHPDILESAGVPDADMIIAVTFADEVNMEVACQIAHSIFNVPTKIARIRQQSYLEPMWADLFSRDHMPIDVIISPELEVARAISRRMAVPGAFDMIPLADDRVRVIGVRCGEDCPVINTAPVSRQPFRSQYQHRGNCPR